MTLVPADEAAIAEAARILRAGGLVAFPTETVYGLGANALNPDAVRGLFAAKGRPSDNPVIVHVPDVAAAKALCASWPALADRLAAAFWPGPLTLVLPATQAVPRVTTGGLDSVAVRIPAHPVALALLRAAQLPIAAPSANLSGRPSPTTAQHVEADLGAKLPLILDGGATPKGVESTVVSLMGPVPRLLRPGATPRAELEAVAGAMLDASGDAQRSPGTRFRHYAPDAHVVLVDSEALAVAWREHRDDARVAFIASRESGLAGPRVRVPGGRGDGAAWARALFALLRELDGHATIYVEAIPPDGIAEAVLDRLHRAQQR